MAVIGPMLAIFGSIEVTLDAIFGLFGLRFSELQFTITSRNILVIVGVVVIIFAVREVSKTVKTNGAAELLDNSKIEVTLRTQEYLSDTFGSGTFHHRLEFNVTNKNERATKDSEIRFAVRRQPNEARLKWYLGYDGTTEKFEDKTNLVNNTPYTTILKVCGLPQIKNITVPKNTSLDTLFVPLDTKFDIKIGVVGLNHARRDAFFKLTLPSQDKLEIQKSKSTFREIFA